MTSVVAADRVSFGGAAAHFASLTTEAAAAARTLLNLLSGVTPTPLVELPALTMKLDVAALAIMDEAGRLGLGSFEAWGGTYAGLHPAKATVNTEGATDPRNYEGLVSRSAAAVSREGSWAR